MIVASISTSPVVNCGNSFGLVLPSNSILIYIRKENVVLVWLDKNRARLFEFVNPSFYIDQLITYSSCCKQLKQRTNCVFGNLIRSNTTQLSVTVKRLT